MAKLKNITSNGTAISNSDSNSNEPNLTNDVRYVCKSCSLITESLKKGCDVMQLENGDVIITEVKAVTFQYSWNDKKEKLVRVYGSGKNKKSENNDLDMEEDLLLSDELELA